MTTSSITLAILACAVPLLGADWNRQKAFDYLESRQQQWSNWKPAQKTGGPCISCHTGLPYLLALRSAPGTPRSAAVKALAQGVKSRVLSDPPGTMLNNAGVEAVLNLLTLSLDRGERSSTLEPHEQLAIHRLWERQLQQGDAKGSWTWFTLHLHPVESEHSAYFGAALVQLALKSYGLQSGSGPEALQQFLRNTNGQPLHNRLAAVAFGGGANADTLRELWAAQSEDGGWTTAALGPWTSQEQAPPDSGSNAYSTAWAAYTAHESGVPCSNPALQRALDWLERKQDSTTGAWHSPSMNKVYPKDSMQAGFMTDAATGYATAALSACRGAANSK